MGGAGHRALLLEQKGFESASEMNLGDRLGHSASAWEGGRP